MIEQASTGAFMDMGLGKTVCTLTAFLEIPKKACLVIAPLKVAESVWSDEIEKWDHLNHLRLVKVLGSEKQRKAALTKKADLYIINRENVVWLVEYFGSNWPFDFLIIDELSSFKSHDSKRFRALKLILKYVKKTIGLTGTPAPNGLLDLWAQVFLLDKGERLEKSFAQYRLKYFDPNKRNGHIVFNYKVKKGDELLGDDFYQKEIMNKIGDICFSMRTEDYINLPEKIDSDQVVHLSPAMQEKYNDFERENVLRLMEDSEELTFASGAALTNKLLQFANGCVYDEFKVHHFMHDEKMDRLEEVIEALNGSPALLFYSFVSDKDRILRKFKQAEFFKTPDQVKRWNDGKIELLVTHPASAGHGLNLQFGGNQIIWFGLPWGLELYQQGQKRIHRDGVVGTVINTRLIAADTVDQEVIKSLNRKEGVQEGVMSAVKAIINKYK